MSTFRIWWLALNQLHVPLPPPPPPLSSSSSSSSSLSSSSSSLSSSSSSLSSSSSSLSSSSSSLSSSSSSLSSSSFASIAKPSSSQISLRTSHFQAIITAASASPYAEIWAFPILRTVSLLCATLLQSANSQQQNLQLLHSNTQIVLSSLLSFFASSSLPTCRAPSLFADSLPLYTLDFPPSPLYPPFSSAQCAVQLTNIMFLFPTGVPVPPMLNHLRSRLLRRCCGEAEIEMLLCVLHHSFTKAGEGIGIARCVASLL
ncbi:uncharacterized protein MONOS_16697 [Monocercomonoides exilis]|uniref:uncharacterized protein n=1 Tax=Monocercomonoides exilis TaxID=2049356 RepID=UPI0035597657|nr:hypothetical protein MONOS_16697 [Monocercomonoides exilis]|eukprot:MONOS_16697.1-p1 / transcript=MONOS_16697.1 / gene=MONOS_16697 / organism=Monocercomonoides_exilis_PA203 / gene_product=unspecified product / transcript_product=unspecified product / location=Mono_scaffold02028:887-1709(+) / protein_length=259 / sequence_SO=supercontig / SO=protein_coding / is_pseudo=false